MSAPQIAWRTLNLATNTTQIGWIALKFKQALEGLQVTCAKTDEVCGKKSDEKEPVWRDYPTVIGGAGLRN
jgi:hypothetical protein